MMGTFLIFITTSIIILTIYGSWLGSKEKKDLNISNDEDDRKSQNKKELNLNEDVRNEIIFKKAIRNDFEKLKSKKLEFDKSKSYQDLLDNFKNLKDDEIIKAVYKFSRNVYIEELNKFSFDRSNLIDNYLNPTDNIILLNLLENVRNGLKVTRDALLDQLGLDEFQCKILEMSFKVTVGEVEKPVLEGYLRLKNIKMLKGHEANIDIKTKLPEDEPDGIPKPLPSVEKSKIIQSKLYFYKFTQTKKGIVTSTQPIGTKLIGGVEVPVREMSGSQSEVKFGFTAITPELAAQMNVAVGDELPLEITDKPVLDGNGEAIPKLFWAH